MRAITRQHHAALSVLIGLGLLMAPVWAATPVPAPVTKPAPTTAVNPATAVSLDECIRIALQNQLDVLVGQQSVVSAKAKSTQASSSYYPQVSVQSNPLLITGSSNNVFRTSSTQGTTLSVTQNFYDGGLREATAAAARYGITQNQAALTRTFQTVAYTVTQNYFATLLARRLAEVADSQVHYAAGQLDLVKGRVDAGAAAQSDELPIQAQLASAQVSQLSAHNAIRTALIALQSSMGSAIRPGFDIQEVTIPPLDKLQPLPVYLDLANKNRPDIRETHAAVQSAGESVTAARINMLPRPVIGGEYDNLVSGGASPGWSITGGIAFSLFDGGANKAVYTQARAEQTIARDQEAQLAKTIEADVQTAYLNLTNATQLIAASAVGLKAAQTNYDVQTARYREGLATPLDLLNAEVALVTAQSSDVQARYGNYTAQAQLAYAIGKQGGLNDK